MNILSAIFEPPKCSLDIWALCVPKNDYVSFFHANHCHTSLSAPFSM